MNHYLRIPILIFVTLLVNSLNAQIRLPQPSPTVKVVQNFGVSEVTLEYSRPSLRGRSFGQGNLDYYGRFWRTGANAATNISFGADVTINGQKLPAGKYGFYTIPDRNEWTIIFSKNTGLTEGSNYKSEEDALTLKVRPEVHSETETFTIDFRDFSSNAMIMDLKWDKFKIPLKIETNVKDNLINNTDKEIGKFAVSLTQAASYAFDNNDLSKGQKWLNQSIALEENYYNLYVKSKYLAKEEHFSEAVNMAEKALALAKEAKNDFYISENEKNIKEWYPKVNSSRGRKK